MCFPSKAKVWGQWSFLVLGVKGRTRFALGSSGPVLTVPELQYHCGVSPGWTAMVRGAVQGYSTALSLPLAGSTSHLHQPARPPQPPGCAPGHSSSGGHPGCRPRKAQSWRGGRAKATVAMGPFRVEVQLWPSATAEPSQWAGLGEAPPRQRAVALRATHHSSSRDRWE